MAKLTEKQKRFSDEYLIDLNATRAYKASYKSCKKDETARVNGSKLLTKTNVKAYIDEKMRQRSERTEITQDKVLNELAAVAFSNGAKYANVIEKIAYEATGEPLRDKETGEVIRYKVVDIAITDELSDTDKKAISCIKQGKNGIEVSTGDKVRALELLGKHLGMFKDKIEVSGAINNPYAKLTTEDLKKLINDG